MMKKILAGASVLLALIPVMVHAAPDQTVQKPISIKLGAYLPTNGGRDALGSAAFRVGVDYAFSKTGSDSPALLSGYADYSHGSRHGNSGTVFGVGVGAREYAGVGGHSQSFTLYYGVGVGAYFVTAKPCGCSSKTSTQIGGKLLAGIELPSGPFVEADYTYLPNKVYNANFSGVNVAVGFRF